MKWKNALQDISSDMVELYNQFEFEPLVYNKNKNRVGCSCTLIQNKCPSSFMICTL